MLELNIVLQIKTPILPPFLQIFKISATFSSYRQTIERGKRFEATQKRRKEKTTRRTEVAPAY